MLRIMGAYAHRTRISLLDLNVDIADRRIKRTRVRIRWRGIRVRPTTCEEEHVPRPLLKTRGVCREHKCRPRGPKTDQPDSGPDVDRPGETVTARWNKQNALVRRLANLIDRPLQNGGVIRDSIPLYGETIRRQINCFRILRARRVVRSSEQWNCRRQHRRRGKNCLYHRDRPRLNSSKFVVRASAAQRVNDPAKPKCAMAFAVAAIRLSSRICVVSFASGSLQTHLVINFLKFLLHLL